jgi:phage shock protein PspC (stress-responsive transcriptional regulator)
MNKTIIININGIVFHIEEDAYEVLRRYMTDVKRHFAYSSDSEEIVSDIENRIAEMFVERLEQEKKQVIVLQDVEQVTAQMGAVNDFELEGDDAVFISDQNARTDKKLFRDTDDRIIGGVCSGIGHYFDIEPRWIRVIAVLIVFLGGSGILIYLILWIAMPKAKTRLDKMAMKGEEPNLQNFKKNFDEEVEALHQNIKKARSNASPAIHSLENFLRDLFGHLGSFLGEAFRIFVKLIGVFIIFISVMALLGLIIGLFALLGWSSTELNFPPFNAINPEFRSALYFSAFLIIMVPLTALVFFAIRVLFNRTILTKTGSFTMLIIWIAALCMGAYYGTKLGSEFKEEASLSEVTDIAPYPVYYLKLNDSRFLSHADSMKYGISTDDLERRITIKGDDDWDDHRMVLYIERADVNKPVLVKTFISRGPDFETGLRSARKINYHFQQVDSVLQFDRAINLSKDELWRDQEVRLTLRVPQNTRLMIDGNMDWYVRDINIWDCRPENLSHSLPVPFRMTNEGLRCDTLVSNQVNPEPQPEE